MKAINFKKIFIYILVMLILFQDIFVDVLGFQILKYFDELIVSLLFVFALINAIKTKSINKISLVLLILTAVFSIMGILSCLINSQFIVSRVLASNFIAIKFWVFIISFLNIKLGNDTKNYFLRAIEFFGYLCIFFAITNLILPKLYYIILPISPNYRFGLLSITSLFVHPGKYGWFMLFMGIYYYSNYKDKSDNKSKILFIVYTLLSLFSYRTKVVMSLIVLIIIEIIKLKKKIDKSKIIIGIYIVLLVFLLFNKIILNTYKLYFNNKNIDEARVVLNQKSISIAKKYFPLGVGFGKYGSHYARKYYSEYYYLFGFDKIRGLEPDNSNYATDVFWPSIAGETGTLGFIIYLSMVVILLFYLATINSRKQTVFSLWALYALIQSFCESFGEQSFNSPPQYFFLAIVIGFSIISFEKKIPEDEDQLHKTNINEVKLTHYERNIFMIKGLLKNILPGYCLSLKIYRRYKISRYFYLKHLKALSHLFYYLLYRKYFCIISPQASIGKNILFPHPLGIVIGEGSKIGNNVTIYQNVTLGRKEKEKPDYPTICDNVTIYANTIILGNVTIGKNAVIGCNSVVLRNVKAGEIVSGIVK